MPSTSGAKGVVDALTNTYTDIAKMMLLPDAGQHMQFLQGIQQGIMHYIQMQARASLGPSPQGGQAGMGGMGGGMGQPQAQPPGPPPGPPPGGGMQIAPGGGGGMSGLMQGAQGGPNPDQLRQLLASGAQQ